MSIYSGFATRQQQTLYDNTLEAILLMLTKRTIKFFAGQDSDDNSFCNALNKAYRALRRLEKQKYLEPKLSHAIEPLVSYINENLVVPSDVADKNSSRVMESCQKSQASFTTNRLNPETQNKVKNVRFSSKKHSMTRPSTHQILQRTPIETTQKKQFQNFLKIPQTFTQGASAISKTAQIHQPQQPALSNSPPLVHPDQQLLEKYLKGVTIKASIPHSYIKGFRSRMKNI